MNKINEERREFLKKAGLIFGAGLTLPVISGVLSSCERDEDSPIVPPKPGVYTEVDLTKYPALSNPGGTVEITLPGKNGGMPLIVRRIDAGTFAVHTTACPHQGCPVLLSATDNTILDCSCHHVQFSTIDGTIKANPISSTWAGEPLPSFKSIYDSAKNVLKIEI